MSTNCRHGGEIYDKTVELDYSVNVNPLGLPPAVKKALAEDFSYAERYPDTECRALRAALGKKYALPAEWFLCGNGASELFQLICAVIRPRKALVEAPTFSGYEKALSSVGILPDYHYLDRESGFALSETILNQIRKGCDLLFLCQPNNPVGNTIEYGLLERIARLCLAKKTYLVVDECFLEFVPACEELTARKLLKDNPYVIVVTAFTKTYAMPGMRLGYLITTNADLRAAMKEAQTEWSVSGPAQTAGIAALTEVAYVREACGLILKERASMEKELTEMGLKVYPSEANYLLIEARPDLADRLLEKKILIRRCANYHGLGGREFRIAIRRPEENRVLLSAVREILEETDHDPA